MKNLIITLTLLLGVMSYGQTSPERATITEFTNSAGEMIFLHKSATSTPPGRCQFGDLPRFELSNQWRITSYRFRGDDVLHIDPDVRNANHVNDGIFYQIVSNTDRDAFRNDITDDRDLLTEPNRYRVRNGGLSFDTPCGNSGISRGDYLESQPNWSSTGGSSYYFGGTQDTYITLQPNGVMVEIAFGNNIEFFPFTNVVDAYAKLQELLELRSFERELIALGFRASPHHMYDWDRTCPTTGFDWRVEVVGNQINLRDSVLGFNTVLSIEDAMTRIRARSCP